MNKNEYKKIIKEIAETQDTPAGVVDDIIEQYFDLAARLTERETSATLDT